MSVKVENVQRQKDSAQPKPATTNQLYPLKRQWTWWYLNDKRTAKWGERLKKVYAFKSVPEFWDLYDAVRQPSELNDLCDYSVFRDNIQPMWESPVNAQGGRWLITIEKSRPPEVVDTIWLEILMALIGEQFGDDMKSICGMVCNVRRVGFKISLWTKNCDDDEANMRIGLVLKKKLLNLDVQKNVSSPLFDIIRYEDHKSFQNTGLVKSKLTISAKAP